MLGQRRIRLTSIEAAMGCDAGTTLNRNWVGRPILCVLGTFYSRLHWLISMFRSEKVFLPHPRVKVSIVGSLRDREVACSASDRQGSNFESCVWRTLSSQSSHHPQEVLLAQFSLYVHKGGLKPDSFSGVKKTRGTTWMLINSIPPMVMEGIGLHVEYIHVYLVLSITRPISWTFKILTHEENQYSYVYTTLGQFFA